MVYVEAPDLPPSDALAIFLAGGITGCPDWQADAVGLMERFPVALCNPRRKQFDVNDPNAAEEQVGWEFRQLRRAAAILFWFPKETLCPIVLYELGAWSMTSKQLFVGVHPDYARRQDVEIQTRLVRPSVKVVYDLPTLIRQVADWLPMGEETTP